MSFGCARLVESELHERIKHVAVHDGETTHSFRWWRTDQFARLWVMDHQLVPKIRVEDAADHDPTARVVAAAFGSSAESELVDAIRASPEYVPELSLVAQIDGVIVGHVMISDASLEDGATTRRIAMLSPLAVEPELQGRGIGAALVRAVTAGADDRGEPLVVLEGSPA